VSPRGSAPSTTFAIARLLFRANLRTRHRRTLLGYAWLAIPGVFLAATFTLLRKGALLQTGEVSLPYPLFVLSGMFLWQSFSDAINLPIQQLNQQRRFLSLVPAPFEAVLIAAVCDAVLNLAVRMALLLAAALLLGVTPLGSWLLVPLAGVSMIVAGFALCLLIAPLAQLYDDVATIAGMALTAGVLFVPVFYPIPAESLLANNPLTAIFDRAREWMGGAPSAGSILPVAIAALAIMLPGWLFNRVSRPYIAAVA
jgi:lipopolysaccharide transport system permease protein